MDRRRSWWVGAGVAAVAAAVLAYTLAVDNGDRGGPTVRAASGHIGLEVARHLAGDPAAALRGRAGREAGAAVAELGKCTSSAAEAAAADEPLPAGLTASLDAALAHPAFGAGATSASVWIDGYGEVATREPDLSLLPASNQKLLTAIAALVSLPHDLRFETTVRAGGPVEAGTVRGDLVLVGGGDPTLRSRGGHSLDDLAAQVRGAGVTTVEGNLVVDDSFFDGARTAPGWQDWHMPTYTGPMSALTVDDNRHRTDADYLAHPDIGNGELFRSALSRVGIHVAGATVGGRAPLGAPTLAGLASPPLDELVTEMLLRSDNEHAEAVLREIGRHNSGVGSTPAGAMAAERAVAEALCLALPGNADDGSGMSRLNARSAREWREILQAARGLPWWPAFAEGLPVAARTGTLAGRFGGTPAAGNVQAKTGTIIGGVAFSGYATTADGRDAVFSVIVNGDAAPGAVAAIDALVVAIAGSGA